MRFISKTNFFFTILSTLCFAFLIQSCSSVKNYPHGKAFVYQNKIILKGNISKDEKKRLTLALNNCWDDSMRAVRVQQVGIFFVLRNPPTFDSNNITHSRNYMNAYLNSQGYYHATYSNSFHLDTLKKQIRATVQVNINLGKIIQIDSVSYNMIDSTKDPIDSSLQKLALKQAKNSLLIKGEPYTKESVNSELERMMNWYHQNGYYKFSRENIYALIDTLDTKLLTITLDPFKQVQLIAEADRKKKENPLWDITIASKQGRDTLAFHQFHVGKLFYYPDLKNAYYNPDSTVTRQDFMTYTHRESTVFYSDEKYYFRPLREHTYLRNGDLYNESLYFKTLNRLSQIGTWKQVDIKTQVRDKDSIDLYIFMVPEKKQSFTVDQEFSRNTGDIASSNLLGLATNFSYKNRNIWHQSIQSLTSLRFGVELNVNSKAQNAGNNSLLQTTQVNLSHTYIFPRLILPIKHWAYLDKLDNKRTLFSVAGSYTDRKALYGLRSLVTSVGFEASKGNNTVFIKLPNIELYKVDTLLGLISLFKTSPFLRNSFRDGNVVGTSITFTKTFNSRRNPSKNHYIRLGYEESGLLVNQFFSASQNIFNYNKLEAEYRFIKKYTETEFASRIFTGVGLHGDQTLPVFKQYFLGGPNSMRAWGLRQLGNGSSLLSDTSTGGYTDRYGDLSIEGNLEYRFPLGTIGGVKIGSALYSDFGNIWTLKKQDNDPNASISLNRLERDIAIGVGSGIRVDFSYFLIRVDFAYKVKDPARLSDDGWMNPKHFEWTSTRENGVKIRNYAVQLGIGLPF